MALLTPQQQQEQMKRFFNPESDWAPSSSDQQQPAAPQPVAAAPAPGSQPNLQPPAATPAAAAPPSATPAPQGNNQADNSNYLFHQVGPEAFMEPRPVGALDNVHGFRKALALSFGGLASFGAGLNHREDPTLTNWTNQELAQRQYDANEPRLRAKAELEANQTNLGNERTAGEIAQTGAATNLTNTQASNLKLVGPPGKQDFLKEFSGKLQTGQFDPQQLFNEYSSRGRAFGVSRQDLVELMNNTPETAPSFKIGPQGIREPIQFHGRNWYGDEADAPDVVKTAAKNAGNVETKVHNNKLQEQAASRSNIVLKNDLSNGPFGKYNVPSGTTGEAALANVDPAAAATVRMIGDGKTDFATMTSRMPPEAKANLAALVHAYNPNFDQATFQVRKGVQEYMTSGAGGDQLQAFNTAIEHMKTFNELSKALDNTDVTSLNKVGNWTGKQFGSDKVTNFNIAKQAFLGEVGKAFAGANVAEGDRKSLVESVESSNSPQQLKGAAATALQLLEGKRKAIEERANSGMQGKANFGSNSEQNTQGPAQATTPQTHKFSLSAWQKANPQGDVKAAEAAARAQKYEVVP